MATSHGTGRRRSYARSARSSSTPASHRPLLLCFRRKLYSMELLHDSGSSLAMTISYLEKLNPQQRRAVEHGGSALAESRPLLIIAGAGSGKTNTLAHRVAHLKTAPPICGSHCSQLPMQPAATGRSAPGKRPPSLLGLLRKPSRA